ncbi:hypothetical protein [Natrinema versiforme]|uniref:DUF8069 domain-containing protein n=1 Tax=Natrinema versiforme JCM 10478 TaxID=1227496 RepID=L9XQ90_9EURY|nr:hypothetical protein [Natrinema versiforme]ELY62783.1 hypothetical protein C489_20941 [Natrinema versiforme JCM 10478]
MPDPNPRNDTSADYEQLEKGLLVHEPSGTTFDLTTQLAVFHRGWTAARDADAEAE